MFKPCPNCGFLVALIAGREASQRCPRCSSALLDEAALGDPDADIPPRRRRLDDTDRTAGEVATRQARHAVEPVQEASPVPPRPTDGGDGPDADALQPGASDAAEPHADTTPASSEAAAHAPDGPSFATRPARPGTDRKRWPWAIALPLLALLLGVQLLLAQRADLARDAGWRPLVLQACAVVGCDVPAWHEPAAYAMVARGVRPDASRPGVLHVTATVRNDARWAQQPPRIVLSLADVDGRRVGARIVLPSEYGAPQRLVAPGDTIDAVFDVREPATRVDAFDFQLQ